MRDKEFFKMLLDIGDESLFAAILSIPGLQFLYPVSGLEWVEYCGMGLAKIQGKSGKISCDPSKIKAARYLPPTEAIQPRIDVVDHALTLAGSVGAELVKDLERDTNAEEPLSEPL